MPGFLFLHLSSVAPTQVGDRDAKKPKDFSDAVDLSVVTGVLVRFGDEWVGFQVRLRAADLLLHRY